MYIYTKFEVDNAVDFPWCGPAENVVSVIKELHLESEFSEYIGQMLDAHNSVEGVNFVTMNTLNDFVGCTAKDAIAQYLGYKDYDELYKDFCESYPQSEIKKIEKIEKKGGKFKMDLNNQKITEIMEGKDFKREIKHIEFLRECASKKNYEKLTFTYNLHSEECEMYIMCIKHYYEQLGLKVFVVKRQDFGYDVTIM